MTRWGGTLETLVRSHGVELLAEAAALVGPARAVRLVEDALAEVFGAARTPAGVDEARERAVAAMRRLALRADDATAEHSVATTGPAPAAPPASAPEHLLDALEPRQRAALALRLRDGLSVAAIARESGLPLEDVRAMLAAGAARVGMDPAEALEGGTDGSMEISIGRAG